MKLRGVNLGNWLSLERWMQPEMFDGVDGDDEAAYFEDLSQTEAMARLEHHYDTHITEEDFDFLAENGVNLLRIPVPFYIFGEEGRPASIQYLDRAFEWAGTRGMKILIDLHSVRGGQNGFDNSGFSGLCTWHKHPEYVEETLQTLEKLADRYKDHKALFGIAPINEPANSNLWARNVALYSEEYPERIAASEPVPDDFLRKFYLDAYNRLKAILPEDIIIVLADQFNLAQWNDFMPADQYPNVWIDAHKYLCFAEGMLDGGDAPAYDTYSGNSNGFVSGGRVLENYLRLINHYFADEVLSAAKYHPIIVGEWNIVQSMNDIANSNDQQEIRDLYRKLSDAQIELWDQVEGGAYWSYKVTDEKEAAWDFRKCVNNGWLSYR